MLNETGQEDRKEDEAFGSDKRGDELPGGLKDHEGMHELTKKAEFAGFLPVYLQYDQKLGKFRIVWI